MRAKNVASTDSKGHLGIVPIRSNEQNRVSEAVFPPHSSASVLCELEFGGTHMLGKDHMPDYPLEVLGSY